MDDTVRGLDVDKAVVDEDNRLVDTWWVKTDCDLISLKVEGRSHQTFGQVRREDLTPKDMVQQEVV